MILVAALRKIGPDATPQQLRTYISGLKNFVGVNGPYDFVKYPQRGLGLRLHTSYGGTPQRVRGLARAARPERRCEAPGR